MPSLHLGVAAIGKGAFGSPLTTAGKFTLIYIYIYITVCLYVGGWKYEFLRSHLYIHSDTHIYTSTHIYEEGERGWNREKANRIYIHIYLCEDLMVLTESKYCFKRRVCKLKNVLKSWKNELNLFFLKGPFPSVTSLQRIFNDNQFCIRGSKHGISKENPGGLKKNILKKYINVS